MFNCVVLVQPENNVCQKFLIKSNYKKELCHLYMKDNKKHFATFDSFKK